MAKQEITITLKIDEIYYDVANKTTLTSRSMSEQGKEAQSANMQVSEDEDNKYQIHRSIREAESQLRIELSPWLSSEEKTANNALRDDQEAIQMVLEMPSNYNLSMNGVIATSMHQYIVNVCLAQWFTISNPDNAGAYVQMSIGNMADIKAAINKRVRPKRPS